MEDKKYISLREIGRRLKIPTSTVVHYKNRFFSNIPSTGHGSGRSCRFPVESLEVFKKIREMSNNKWSVQQIEQELSLRKKMICTDDVHQRANNENFILTELKDTIKSFASSMESIVHLLKDQAGFRRELDELNEELSVLQHDRITIKKEFTLKVEDLEEKMNYLKKDRDELRGFYKNRKRDTQDSFPSEDLMSRPLVVHDRSGNYLGVLDKSNRPFHLNDFIELIKTTISEINIIDFKWSKTGKLWTLIVRLNNKHTGIKRKIILVIGKTMTRKKNIVTEIYRLNINGKDMPESMQLRLFKLVKENFKESYV